MKGPLHSATVASLEAAIEWLDRYPNWKSVRSAYLEDFDEKEDRIAGRLDTARRWLGRSQLSVTTELALVRLAIPATGGRAIVGRPLPEVAEKTILPAKGSDGEHCWTTFELMLPSRHVERVVNGFQDQTFEVEDPLYGFWFRSPQGQAPPSFATSLLLWALRKARVDLAQFQDNPRGVRFFVPAPEAPLALQIADQLSTSVPRVPTGSPRS